MTAAARALSLHEPGPLGEGDVVAGKYRLGPVLGSGGMGVVYAAEHLGLGERVALKFLHAAYADNAQVVERFLREARAQFRIRSDHVVRVLDVGTAHDGAPYIAMEYLDGASLADLCVATPRMPVPIACELARQACEALESAHALGIVHRDVKPANLMVGAAPGGTVHVKLLDFGIAQVARAEGLSRLTMTETVLGTPLYMAPEQMRSARSTDLRSDLWSIGVVLFRMLTGSLPFYGESLADLVVLQHNAPAPRVDALVPEVPAAIADAVARCLSVDPAARFASASELGAALAPFARATAAAEIFAPLLSSQTVVMSEGAGHASGRVRSSTPVPSSMPPASGENEGRPSGLTFVRRKVHDTSGATAFAVHELAIRDERRLTTGPLHGGASAARRAALATPALLAGGMAAGLLVAALLLGGFVWTQHRGPAPTTPANVIAPAIATASVTRPAAPKAPESAPAPADPVVASLGTPTVVLPAPSATAKRQPSRLGAPSGPASSARPSIYTENW